MAFFLMGKKHTNIILPITGALAAVALLSMGKKVVSHIDTNSTGNYIRPLYDGKPSTFVRLSYPYAAQANKVFTQVPIILMLTQGGLESEFGKAAPGNNFWGIKAGKNYPGETQLLKTTEILSKGSGYSFPQVISITKMPSGKYHWVIRDYFRKYESPYLAFLDYAKLMTSGRYKSAFNSRDINTIIDRIAAAGYATDPKYASKLKNIASLIQKQINTLVA